MLVSKIVQRTASEFGLREIFNTLPARAKRVYEDCFEPETQLPPPDAHPQSVALAAQVATRPMSAAPLSLAPEPNARYAPSDVLMIGDSQSQGTKDALSRNTSRARAAGRAAPAAGIRFHSRSGRGTKAFLLWLATPAAKEQVRSARLVIIQLGGNDVTPGRKPDAIIRDMQRILRQLHAANPGVKVVISAVPVRWEWFVKNRPAEARRTGRLSAEENQRILDATNAWIAAGGDDAVRFGYFDVNRYIGFCSESAARRVGRTCEGNDDETSQRPEFRRARADVHLNLRGYDSVAGAIIERYLRVEQQET